MTMMILLTRMMFFIPVIRSFGIIYCFGIIYFFRIIFVFSILSALLMMFAVLLMMFTAVLFRKLLYLTYGVFRALLIRSTSCSCVIARYLAGLRL